MQQSSQNKLKTSYKNNNISINVSNTLVIMMIIIEIILIIFSIFIEKNIVLSLCVFGICGIIDIIFVPIIKNIFSKEIIQITNILQSHDSDAKIDFKTIPFKFVIIIALCFAILITSTVGGVRGKYYYDTKKDSPSATGDVETQPISQETTTEEYEPPYDFSTVTDCNKWPNHYFDDELKENDFVDNLEKSIRAIQKITPTSDEELKIMSNYGTIVRDANEHYDYLVNILLKSSDYIINGPLPTECYLHIHEIHARMEEACETPANRKAIMNCYLLGGLHNLGKNGAKYEYEQAVRYAWGTLYIRIAWGQYDGEDVSNIINSYEHLRGEANQEEIKRIELIVNVLNRLKIRLDENPPNPICTK